MKLGEISVTDREIKLSQVANLRQSRPVEQFAIAKPINSFLVV